MLAEPNALFAAQLVSCSAFAMARQDALPVRAVVVIVIDVPMLGGYSVEFVWYGGTFAIESPFLLRLWGVATMP